MPSTSLLPATPSWPRAWAMTKLAAHDRAQLVVIAYQTVLAADDGAR
jgi:hypothetical protein